VANKIDDYLHKSEALSAIAQALSSTDVDKDEKLFDEAVSLASNAYDEELKPGVLSKVAQGLAPTNVKEALSVANTIDALFDKSEALSAIALACAGLAYRLSLWSIVLRSLQFKKEKNKKYLIIYLLLLSGDIEPIVGLPAIPLVISNPV
jgi:hypothetical protein